MSYTVIGKFQVCRCKQGETVVNSMCRKAIYEVSPMGRCDPRKGLDCIGESHCYYGICVCLYGLINVGNECASPDVLTQVPPGSPCDKGQICQGGSSCVSGMCRCQKDEVIDVNKKCVKKSSTVAFYMYPGGPPNVTKPHRAGHAHPIPTPDPNFSQIVNANHMTVNLVDPGTLRALLSQQYEKVPVLGEPCDDRCGDGAACLGGICRCEHGYEATPNGKCVLGHEPTVVGNVATAGNISGSGVKTYGSYPINMPYGAATSGRFDHI